jgi:uncharacterized protein YjbI with pentapeptide repeats
MSDSKPLRLFCSYSHKDEAYLNELRTWLRGFEWRGLIEWWHDREITPGWEWEEAIDENLRMAEIIILLVTPDFMGSRYVYEQEIGKAVERHERGEARVIPIIVRPAYWKWVNFGRLQALPKDAKPITTWPNRDEAWLDVVEGIQKAVEELLDERQEQAAREEELRKRLDGLYDRARRSHQDQEWQAVVDVFAQIHAEDPAYSDPEGLLRSANEALQRAQSAAIEEEQAVTYWAQLLGADLSQLEGSGAGGRITVKDVVSAAPQKLQRAFLKQANLFGANLESADLFGAYLNFQEANLLGATLRRANLQRANLKGAHLVGADLQYANLQGAYLQATDLMTQDQLKSTIGSSRTELPQGLNRPEWWSKSIEEQKRLS